MVEQVVVPIAREGRLAGPVKDATGGIGGVESPLWTGGPSGTVPLCPPGGIPPGERLHWVRCCQGSPGCWLGRLVVGTI
jgi:hypothetical protein